MSGIDNWDENERQLYAVGTRAILDDLERQRQEWNAGAALDTTSTDALVRAHNERMRELEDQQRAWLASFINDDDEPAPTQDVAAQGDRGASLSSSGSSDGHSPGQQPHSREAEMERARALKEMDMATYAARRADPLAELGVQSPTSANRFFFSQETQ